MAILSPPSVVLMGRSHCHLLPILPVPPPMDAAALRCPFMQHARIVFHLSLEVMRCASTIANTKDLEMREPALCHSSYVYIPPICNSKYVDKEKIMWTNYVFPEHKMLWINIWFIRNYIYVLLSTCNLNH